MAARPEPPGTLHPLVLRQLRIGTASGDRDHLVAIAAEMSGRPPEGHQPTLLRFGAPTPTAAQGERDEIEYSEPDTVADRNVDVHDRQRRNDHVDGDCRRPQRR